MKNSQCKLLVFLGVFIALTFVSQTIKPVLAGVEDMEIKMDRPGGDYNSFDLPSNNPLECEQACNNDANCAAFTFKFSSGDGTPSKCWLKNTVPQAVPDASCISGLRRAEAVVGERVEDTRGSWTVLSIQESDIQYGVDLPGNDYRDFDVNGNSYQSCKIACVNDNNCRAFTFLRAGIDGSPAHCWLKTAASTPVRHQDYVSAIKPVRAVLVDPNHAYAVSHNYELDSDRPGHDSHSVELEPSQNISFCEQVCNNMRQGCLAFTFVPAGVHGSNARCYFKNVVPRRVSQQGFYSWLKYGSSRSGLEDDQILNPME